MQPVNEFEQNEFRRFAVSLGFKTPAKHEFDVSMAETTMIKNSLNEVRPANMFDIAEQDHRQVIAKTYGLLTGVYRRSISKSHSHVETSLLSCW